MIPYADKHGIQFAVAAGSQTGKNLNGMYGVRGIPHSFLIDTEGNVDWHGHPNAITDSMIKGALKGVKEGEANQILRVTIETEMEGAAGKAAKLAGKGELAKALRAFFSVFDVMSLLAFAPLQ